MKNMIFGVVLMLISFGCLVCGAILFSKPTTKPNKEPPKGQYNSSFVLTGMGWGEGKKRVEFCIAEDRSIWASVNSGKWFLISTVSEDQRRQMMEARTP